MTPSSLTMDKLNTFWGKFLQSDETKIELFGHNDKKYYMFRGFNVRLSTVKHGGGSIMMCMALC